MKNSEEYKETEFLSEKDKEKLKEMYREDIEKLEKLLERNFNEWKV